MLWVPVQLAAPPEPDLEGALIVAGMFAILAVPGFGLLVPAVCRLGTWPEQNLKRRTLVGGVILVIMWATVFGVLPFLLSRDLEIALRLGAPRVIYGVVLLPLLGWIIRHECG